MKDCRTLRSHLEQLVREGRLKQFLHQPNGQGGQARSGSQRNAFSRTLLGTINVIFTAPRRVGSHPSKVMSVARPPVKDSNPELKRVRMENQSALSFSDEDKVGTIQLHDDAPVVTHKVEGYDMKKVLVDQGSGTEIIYPDLYKGLNLRPKDLTAYKSPLLGFYKKLLFQGAKFDYPCK